MDAIEFFTTKSWNFGWNSRRIKDRLILLSKRLCYFDLRPILDENSVLDKQA
jgi:hypothetical protein